MITKSSISAAVRPLAFATAVVFVAAALRLWPLDMLQNRIQWLTFYPAVMVSALFGGWIAGVAATILSLAMVLHALPLATGFSYVNDVGDWQSVAVFAAMSLAVSLICERGRRANENELRAARERDLFFEISLDMLCISKADGYFKRLSPAFTTTLGWSVEELLARPFIEFVHPEDVAGTLAEVERQVRRGEKVLHFENRYRHKDGTWRWLAWMSVPQPGGFMYATARDVTERRRMEEALARSEENLKVTLNSIGDAVMATDLQGAITQMNPVAEALTGWRSTEAVGRPIGEVFRVLNERTRQQAPDPATLALETGEVQGVANHTLLQDKEGRERPISESAAPIRSKEGRILGAVLIFRDATAERTLERELEVRIAERTEAVQEALATLDAMNDAAFVCDAESFRYLYVNRGAMRQLGYSFDELKRMTPMDLSPGLTQERIREIEGALARGERSMFTLTAKNRHKDGFLFDVEVNVQRITTPMGKIRLIAIARDITERVRAERRALRSQRLESLGTLAGGVAHDLNNALAPIMMVTGMLRKTYSDIGEYLDTVDQCVKRSAEMVHQLLTFARGSEGEKTTIQPFVLVEEMARIVKATFPKNIALTTSCDSLLPAITGDPTQLHQVLLNLCVNARDAMPDGGTLRLRAGYVEIDAAGSAAMPDANPGRYVAFVVEDTGTGIPPEIMDRIFDPFFTSKAADKGTGLGLSTVMGIVRGQGGYIQVSSKLGAGSAFTAAFPLAENQAGAKVEPVQRISFRGRGEKVLFVDDEAPIRMAARMLFTRANVTPIMATDGADALIKLADNRRDLSAIITDLHMPHMDAFTFLKAALHICPDIPAGVMSGRMEEEDRKRLAELGVRIVLDKPCSDDQLLMALQSLLKTAPIRGE